MTLVVALTVSAACSTIVGPEGVRLDGEDGGLRGPDDADAATSDPAPADAGAPNVSDVVGHPLCRATASTCFPGADVPSPDASAADATGASCVSAAAKGESDAGQGGSPDGGSAPPPAPMMSYGETCRVTGGAPACDAVGSVVGGGRCERATDCGQGFDCVVEADGARCRRYCCTGSCRDHLAPNGSPTYCDATETVDGARTVPVCAPVRRCRLLTAGECGPLETCGVVDEEGTTSCVPVGPAKVDEGCDEQRCGAGLACLGAPGRRRCYELCRMGDPCGAGRECVTSALFRDPTFGVCQAP